MRYLELKIQASEQGVEQITALLLGMGITEMSIDDPHDMDDILQKKHEYGWDYIEDNLKENLDREPVISLYFDEADPKAQQMAVMVKDGISALQRRQQAGEFGQQADLGSLTVTENIVDDGDWKDKWKEFFKPTKVTDRIVVKPTWEEYTPKEDELVIEIDPGMAFGTGTHETTSLCMKLMEKYLGGEELTEAEIKGALRQRVLNNEIILVTCGSAFKNKGVQAMLDAVIDYLPSPVDVPAINGILDDGKDTPAERHASDDEPFAALAFKIATDPFVGNLTFFRVYSGVVNSGDTILNSVKTARERFGRIVQMHANKREEIKEVRAGDIAAAIGLKDVTTGDTLCDPDHPIILERMEFPEPVISIAVEPKTKADQEKMGLALGRLAKEDPSFRVWTDEESNQTIIAGMGELHLDIIVDRMKREFNVEANVGKPQVAYREAIRAKVTDIEGKHAKQSGGRGQYGHVVIDMYPLEPGSNPKGYEFINDIKGGVIPGEYIPAVDKGIQEQLKAGPLAGYPVVDMGIRLHFGSYHDVDSSELAFKLAASIAFKDGFKKAKPVLLEPIMKVEVETPEENTGDVIGDLSRRRGMLRGQESNVTGVVIHAEVPLSEMFGYATQLRSLTKGRASYSMEFLKYDDAPNNVAQAVIEARGK